MASSSSSPNDIMLQSPVVQDGIEMLPVAAEAVPLAVQDAVHKFIPPDGYVDFPLPTKNNAQRSLIYYYGRRVQSLSTGKSKWFCLASAQCRQQQTTISTSANISGCTRHLQVFHQLISPKTVQMTKKVMEKQKLPMEINEKAHQEPSEPPMDRIKRLYVVQLLPLEALDMETSVIPTLLTDLMTKTQQRMRELIQTEACGSLPMLHVHIQSQKCFSSPFHQHVQVSVSFLSRQFELQDCTLSVQRFATYESLEVKTQWLQQILTSYGIMTQQIRSVCCDPTTVQWKSVVENALQDPTVWDFSLLAQYQDWLDTIARDHNSVLYQLTQCIHEVLTVVATEKPVADLLSASRHQLDLLMQQKIGGGLMPWDALVHVLMEILKHWDTISSSTNQFEWMNQLQQKELQELVSILHPIQVLFEIFPSTKKEVVVLPEALIQLLLLQESTLNPTQPLAVLSLESTEDTILRPLQALSSIATQLRQEVAQHWPKPSAMMLLPLVFHPCFRHLRWLKNEDDKTKLLQQIQELSSRMKSTEGGRKRLRRSSDSTTERWIRQQEALVRLGLWTSEEKKQEEEATIDHEWQSYLTQEKNLTMEQLLGFWRHKTLEYPVLSTLAQSVLGVSGGRHPVNSHLRQRICSFQCQAAEAESKEGQMQWFLHLNQQWLPE